MTKYFYFYFITNLYSQNIPTLFTDSTKLNSIINDTIISEDKKICREVKKQLDEICDCNFKLTKKIKITDIGSGNRRGGNYEIIQTKRYYIIKYENGGVNFTTQVLVFEKINEQYRFILRLEGMNGEEWRRTLQGLLYSRTLKRL